MQQLTSIDIFWRQLTNINMTSIVILSSSLTKIDVKWLDASVMTNFDVLWRLWRFLTFFDVFQNLKILKNFIDENWRKSTKIDACVNVYLRQLTSIFVGWRQNNLNLCKISIIFQIILFAFISNSLFKWKKIQWFWY